MSWHRTSDRVQKIEQVLRRRQPTLTVIMENIHDPHNVAAIMRSCDATGVLDLHLLYNDEPFPDFELKGKQSSAGTRKWLRRHEHTDAGTCFSSLKKRGFRVYTSRLDETAIPLHELDLTEPVALVFGNESRGISDEVASLADGSFVIPMVGMVQSLNVSVATAVTLYEAMRQRHLKEMYSQTQVSDEEYQELLTKWTRV